MLARPPPLQARCATCQLKDMIRECARPLQRLSAPACPPLPAARYATRQTLYKTQIQRVR